MRIIVLGLASTVLLVAVSFLVQLKSNEAKPKLNTVESASNTEWVAGPPEESSEASASVAVNPDVKTPSIPVNATEPPVEIPNMTSDTFATKEGMQRWLEAFKNVYSFDETDVEITYWTEQENRPAGWEYKVGDDYAFEYYKSLVRQNPEAYIELWLDWNSWDDRYINAAGSEFFNPSNIHWFEPYLETGNAFLVDLGIQHGLHKQSPDLYKELYQGYTEDPEEIINSEFLVGMIEIDYWGVRDHYHERAANALYPSNYFIALESVGGEPVYELAQLMWQNHKSDNYPVTKSRRAARKDRVIVGIEYGIEEAWDELYGLLLDGFHVSDSFEWHFKLENPKTDFPKIRENIFYNKDENRWFVTDS
jgi:hypothetical protein